VRVWGVVKYFADDPPRLTSGVAPTHNSAGLGSPGPGNRSLLPSKPPVGSVRIAAVGGASRVVVKNRHGHVVWQGLLTDGQARRVHGLAPMRVHADNGGVIRLHSNGHLLGLMGEPGSSADRLIRATHPR
jgi:hypothetical protein